ncbi:MAG: nitronate monooxygenase, partial [Cellvibrionales bacterium]|nr:nitronate monooxygenase [Cellvibrionales bacterium]
MFALHPRSVPASVGIRSKPSGSVFKRYWCRADAGGRQSKLKDIRVTKAAPINNRVTAILGTDYPIIQAPMGWIARAQLASAVSNAGGMGIIETASGEFDIIEAEVRKMRDLTDKPFGMNIALSYVKGSNIIDFVIEQGIKFVTTSSGSPAVCTEALQAAGIKVF